MPALARRPRVLLVGPVPPPAGGVETVTLTLLGSDLAREFEMRHFDISHRRGLHNAERFSVGNFGNAGDQVARFGAALRAWRPALVHLPVAGTASGFCRDSAFILMAHAMGARLVGHLHGGNFNNLVAGARGLKGRGLNTVLSRLDHMVVLSAYWERLLMASCLARAVSVIPNPIDPTFLAELERARAELSDAPKSSSLTVLFVGALGARKGCFELLHAAKAVLPEHPGARFLLVGPDGEPQARKHLQAEAERLGIGRVVAFPGPLYGEDKARAYAGATVLALPSHAENFPVVLLEAMAARVPLVSTTVGGIPDMIVDGATGLLVPPRDTEALAGALRRMLAGADLRARLSTAAYCEAAQKYDATAIAARFAAIYRDVLRPALPARSRPAEARTDSTAPGNTVREVPVCSRAERSTPIGPGPASETHNAGICGHPSLAAAAQPAPARPDAEFASTASGHEPAAQPPPAAEIGERARKLGETGGAPISPLIGHNPAAQPPPVTETGEQARRLGETGGAPRHSVTPASRTPTADASGGRRPLTAQ